MFVMALPPQSPVEHVDVTMSQINPLVEEHVEVPHPQFALFGVVPSFMLQFGTDLQVLLLIDLSQYEVAAEHPLVPQIQPALFGSFPLIRVHSGADRQRQDLEEEQNVVEENNVL